MDAPTPAPTTWGSDRWTLINGDSATALRDLPDACVDSLVCDPPAGIGFMGQEWDGDKGGSEEWITWLAGIMTEALRVLKPGGHALVWALPRTSHWTMTALERAGWEIRDVVTHLFGTGFPKSKGLAPGVGTALKPAAEFWILARKPLEATTTATYQEHGTGGLQIDACRVGDEVRINAPRATAGGSDATLSMGGGWNPDAKPTTAIGRWPANVIVDDPGHVPAAAEFFYCAKPSRAEKDTGCEDLPEVTPCEVTGRTPGSAGALNPRSGKRITARNYHPTVKAQALMRYLVRLVTPPGGLVLDPFAGSGSTLVAALAEGCQALGIEREAKYCEIARRRAEHAERGGP